MPQKQTLISPEVCWHATATNHIVVPDLSLISATETDHIIVRTLFWHMPQKQTIRFPEVHEDICHRNRPKQFQKCKLTYHRKRPTCFRSVCWHTPQKQSIRAPELLCGTKLPMLLPLHNNLSLECHIIYKLVWHFAAFHPNYQCCFLPKINCLINTYINSHRLNILNSSSTCCTLNPDNF